MASLTDKLKSLGVKVGAENLPPPASRHATSLEGIIPGRLHSTSGGDTYIVDAHYPIEYHHGSAPLHELASLQTLSDWLGEQRICQCTPERFAYVDIETTGLSGGTGTLAFLIGAGRVEPDGFHLAQFFLRDPIEEPAQLLAFEEFIAPCETLVTYNGKAFDAPIINTRYTLQGWKSPLPALAHIDLLHLARKLWSFRLPSRTLGSVETFILGARRTQEDVPGWMIPELYFQYLRSGDANPLRGVFYHNAMDVLAMAALLNHVTHLLEVPQHWGDVQHDLAEIQRHAEDELHSGDLIGLARLHEDLGETDKAIKAYRMALERGMPENHFWETLERLSFMLKRKGDYEAALPLWQQAANNGLLWAHIELAKYYEHQAREIEQALFWTQAALERVAAPTFPFFKRQEWKPDLEHRRQRLERKSGNGPRTSADKRG